MGIEALTMAEYIDRNTAIAKVTALEVIEPLSTMVDVKRLLADIPAADVAPVVRCKDCKHCDPENYHCDHAMSTAAPLRRKPDDFCSYGERKERC